MLVIPPDNIGLSFQIQQVAPCAGGLAERGITGAEW